jgi:uncharacterized protein YutE (UPF0331/DUF86 family)
MPQATDEELLTRLRENLKNIRETLSDRSQDRRKQDEAAMERWLQIAVQVCIDIGDRLLAAKQLEEPPRMSEIFPVLAREGDLSPDVARSLSKLAGLRNALVHDYVVYSGPGVFSEAEMALKTLEPAVVEFDSALARVSQRKK